MPYRIQKQKGKFCVVNEDTGAVEKCHATREKAQAHMAALYVNVEEAKMDELITVGSEVKALGNGRIGGYLVRFSNEHAPDLAGDYFTKSTDFYIEPGDSRFVLYDHGFDDSLQRAKIGKGVLKKIDEVGLWIEAQLGIREAYEKAVDAKRKKKLIDYAKGIYKLAEDGKLGWSSGAAGHLAIRDEGKSANWLSEWGIAEFSLTPRPCEPKNMVLTLKSYQEIGSKPIDELIKDFSAILPQPKVEPEKPTIKFGERINQLIADREEDGFTREQIISEMGKSTIHRPDEIERIIAENIRPSNSIIKGWARVLNVEADLLKELADKGTPKTIKGMFEEELAGHSPSAWELHSTLCCVVKKIAEAAEASAQVGNEYDWQEQVATAVKEYSTRLLNTAESQVEMYVGGGGPEEFYLKTGLVTEGMLVTGGLDFEEHSELVVTALTEIVKRFRDNHELRLKAGRVLSEKNRARLSKLVTQMMAAVTECQNLLEETKPMATDMEKNAAWRNHQRIKHELLRNQIGV